eukprot:gene569-1448_t
MLDYAGLCCWTMLLDYAAGLCCWTMLLDYAAGLCWAML